MKKQESITSYIRRRLAELEGQHNRIARETGVAQATVSRIHQGQCSPRLETVEPLLAWLQANDPSARAARRRA